MRDPPFYAPEPPIFDVPDQSIFQRLVKNYYHTKFLSSSSKIDRVMAILVRDPPTLIPLTIRASSSKIERVMLNLVFCTKPILTPPVTSLPVELHASRQLILLNNEEVTEIIDTKIPGFCPVPKAEICQKISLIAILTKGAVYGFSQTSTNISSTRPKVNNRQLKWPHRQKRQPRRPPHQQNQNLNRLLFRLI